MTPEQHEGIVAGFLHLLDRSESVRKNWLDTIQKNAQKSPPERAEALGELVKDTLGLAQAPTAHDIQKMLEHANSVLQDRVAKIKAHGDVPQTVGSMFNTN
ncbi:MAG: hypothetical protein M3N19_04890 [Candidatus Eremiobacteraeota bacterium]|nr:hypothetical protein [Candidatus Eremiobacteraeota bacterium]